MAVTLSSATFGDDKKYEYYSYYEPYGHEIKGYGHDDYGHGDALGYGHLLLGGHGGGYGGQGAISSYGGSSYIKKPNYGGLFGYGGHSSYVKKPHYGGGYASGFGYHRR